MGDRILTEASVFHKRFNTAFTRKTDGAKRKFVRGCTLSRF
ncbi:hypothetical protein HMPREF3197_05511 [Klebsiella pneumoniae]|nr:hypothetical protein HMPREF3197_05511 [Klebsiella pneumoniae]